MVFRVRENGYVKSLQNRTKQHKIVHGAKKSDGYRKVIIVKKYQKTRKNMYAIVKIHKKTAKKFSGFLREITWVYGNYMV